MRLESRVKSCDLVRRQRPIERSPRPHHPTRRSGPNVPRLDDTNPVDEHGRERLTGHNGNVNRLVVLHEQLRAVRVGDNTADDRICHLAGETT